LILRNEEQRRKEAGEREFLKGLEQGHWAAHAIVVGARLPMVGTIN
jgi:hypothetical protein